MRPADLLAAIAGQRFEGGVDGLDPTGEVGHENAFVRVGEHRGGAAQFRLVAFAQRDVLMRADEAHHAVVFVEHGKTAREDVEPSSVLVTELDLELVSLDFARFEPPYLLGTASHHAGRRERQPGIRVVADFVLGVAEHRFPARRQIGLVLREAPVVEAFVGAFHREAKSLLAFAQRQSRRLCAP